MLNNDVTNSADFATILSIFGVANGPYGLASGIFSANPKDVTVILHEFGHTFGGQHSFDNKHNDPKKGYAFGYDYKNKFGTPLSYSNQPLYYWSNPRINHPKLGVPLGHENANDMARYITEERFSLNRGDESRACYTCNAYSGERFYRNTHLTFTGCFLAKKNWKQFGTALAGKGIYYYSNPRTNTNIVFKLFISFKSVCPSGWKEFRDNCYGFAPRYMSFTKAKQFCVARKVKILLLG